MRIAIAIYALFLLPATYGGDRDHEYERRMIDTAKFIDLPLPTELLDKIVSAIEFAFDKGAVREIGEFDLHHAHLLFRKGEAYGLLGFEAILLHSQYEAISSEAFLLRN